MGRKNSLLSRQGILTELPNNGLIPAGKEKPVTLHFTIRWFLQRGWGWRDDGKTGPGFILLLSLSRLIK
jgi:hypothetical protein